ncbi:MAG: alcohol dehydrogenase catalytic domain-containing protein, partial [Pseudomonadota bacterium]
MRAAVVRAFNTDLSIETVDDPPCPDTGVVLQVAACGVCRSDYHGWTGVHPKIVDGSIMGHEYCGTVVETGPKSTHKIGDRLIAPFILGCGTCSACQTGVSNTCAHQIVPGFGAQGAYAEYVAVPFDHNLVTLPDAIQPALAAGLGCRVTTAWHALTDRAQLKAGEWLAVHGTGGVGLSALLLAKMLGARVVVVDVVDDKLTHALAHGADAVVNAAKEDVVAAIYDITNGGADVSVEALGSAQTTNASVECLGILGRHVHVGMPSGDGMMTLNLRAIYAKQLSFFG